MSTQGELDELIKRLRAGGVRRFVGFGVELELHDAGREAGGHATDSARDTVPASAAGGGAGALGATRDGEGSDEEWAEVMYAASLPVERGERVERVDEAAVA